MDRRLIFLLFFALPQVTCAQYLLPAREVNIHNKKYYEEVLALLYQDFSEKPLARYTVIPSFTSEYSFSLETRKGKPFISTRLKLSHD